MSDNTTDAPRAAVDPALVATLAQMRGFAVTHELEDLLGLPVDAQSPVVPVERLPAELTEPAAGDTADTLPPVQDAEERDQLLALLQLAESQLLGWLATLPGAGLEELARALAEKGSALLARSVSGLSDESANALSAVYRSLGFDRKSICDRIESNLDRVLGHDRLNDTVAEAIRLWGDTAADCRKRILSGNLRLVVSLAARHARGFDHRAAVLEGMIGFNRALDSFEPDRGYQLSTYATWWIRQHITRAVMNHRNPIRLPVHLLQEIAQLHREMTDRWRPGVSVAHAAAGTSQELNIRARRLRRLAFYAEPSWPTTWVVDGRARPIEESLHDLTADPNAVMAQGATLTDARRLVSSIYATERERQPKVASQTRNKQRNYDVLKRRLGLGLPKPHTLERISQDYGITRERVRQIESKALRNVKARYAELVARFLNDLLDVERE